MRKRSPREIIESKEGPHNEHAYFKFPRKELIDITKKPEVMRYERNLKKTSSALIAERRKKYMEIHTHPANLLSAYQIPKEEENLYRNLEDTSLIPSGEDFAIFLRDGDEKSMAIAQREADTGKIRGYLIIRKTKETPQSKIFPSRLLSRLKEFIFKPYHPIEGKMSVDSQHYGSKMEKAAERGKKQHVFELFDRFASQYKLKYRFVPVEEYELNAEKTTFIKKGLEKRVSLAFSIAFLMASLFFSSLNLTGNVIGESHLTSSNLLGGVLFLVGTIAAFYYLRK